MKLQYQVQDAQLLEREKCYDGFFSLEKFRFKHKRFDGSWSREVQREVFVRGSATCVLPYDPALGKVLLLEQFRAPAMINPNQSSPWLIELVAGINDKDETPEIIARREALEEADLELEELVKITEYYPSPGGASERVFLFIGKSDLDRTGGIYGLPEEDEDIRAHVVDLDSALEMVKDGRINNAPAIIALQWLQINKEMIDQCWLANNEVSK